MKFFISVIVFIFLSTESVISQCIEIESILVDACGFPEGPNEMVRFRVGGSDILVNDISATWPNNSFLGICQNATTATKVAYMNSTIISCGFFKEPVGGVIPANSNVLFITSVDFDATAHNYAGLSDTLIVIFQCAGNTSGHFANWTTSGCPNSGDRTLTINVGGSCTETVTYDKCLLVNQSGTIGGTSAQRDGARVDFDNAGNPTYENDGCTIPYVPLSISSGFVSGNGVLCDGASTDVEAFLTGSPSNYEWSSSFGSFTDDAALTTTYTPIPGSGDHYIYFSATNGCGDVLMDSLEITAEISPDVNIIENILSNDCNQGAIELVATGANSYIWSSNESTDTIYPSQSGSYIAIGQNNCGTDSDTVEVVLGSAPNCSILGPNQIVLCNNETAEITAQTDAQIYGWSTGEQQLSITVNSEGTYVFTSENDCGVCTDSVEVITSNTTADFVIENESGNIPFTTIINYEGTDADLFYFLVLGDTIFDSTFTFNTENVGEYPVSLLVFDLDNGCIDSLSKNIITFAEAEILIPNVFTPNNDGSNDEFYPTISFAVLKEAKIFNRWGIEIYSFSDEEKWNGKDHTEGVYTYMMTFESFSGETILKQGSFHLIR